MKSGEAEQKLYETKTLLMAYFSPADPLKG
jgi:hypothetical protein